MTPRRALLIVPAVLALALAMTGVARAAGPSGAVIGPTLAEIGQNCDGSLTYIAHGYAAASASATSLGGLATGDFSFRVGGYCLDSAQVALIPAGISGNTTVWSYYLNAASVALVADAAPASCTYTVRVSYGLSLTGAVTISQMEYTVYLRGHAAPDAAGGGLTVVH